MAKKEKTYPVDIEEEQHIVSEPFLEYQTVKKIPEATDYPHKKFERLTKLMPFTQKEWANILDLSDRTLQRYSSSGTAFEGIYMDRLLHIEQLINLGMETFTSAGAFYAWLKKDKNVLGQLLTFQSLYTTRGINELINQLTRIQQGVYS